MLEKLLIYNLQNFMSCILGFLLLSSNGSGQTRNKIGGALRYNYNMSSGKKARKRGGDFGDVFRVNAKGAYKGIL
jgi:hypothetical protein